MFIAEIAPLTRLPLSSPQILSYFSLEKLKKGALVLAPVLDKDRHGIVVNCEDLKKRKLEIKKACFKIKKISRIICKEPVMFQKQTELLQWFCGYYLSPLGQGFKLFLPKSLTTRKGPIKSGIEGEEQNLKTKESVTPLLYWNKERFAFYLEKIKKALEEKKQILFLVTEIETLSYTRDILAKETDIFKNSKIGVFHSSLKTAEEFNLWREARQGKISLIIGTRSSVFLPFKDLGLIIIDEEENLSYKSWDQHPKYNAKTVALKLSKITGAEIILGTELPSVESYYKVKNQIFSYSGQNQADDSKQLISNKPAKEEKTKEIERKIQIIDMREKTKQSGYSIFSGELKTALKEIFQENGKAVLFINRRGVSSTLLCQDCGYVVYCKNCDVPMVYHLENQKPVLICHHCGAKESPPTFCPKCHGWRMKCFGTGTQKVYQELKKISSGIKISILDKDQSPTTQEQKKVIKEFIEKDVNILISTQLLFKFQSLADSLSPLLKLTGVVLIDPILNLPDFRATERAFQVLNKLANFQQRMLIQTYKPDLPIFKYFGNNDIEGFYKEEIKDREGFSYPPFSQIIKLTCGHKILRQAEDMAEELRAKIALRIKGQDLRFQLLGPAPAFVSKVKGQHSMHLIIKCRSNCENLKSNIREIIPGNWSVDIDPVQIL